MIFQNAAFPSSISVNSGFSLVDQFAVSDFAISAAGLPIMLKSSLGGLMLVMLDARYHDESDIYELTPQAVRSLSNQIERLDRPCR